MDQEQPMKESARIRTEAAALAALRTSAAPKDPMPI